MEFVNSEPVSDMMNGHSHNELNHEKHVDETPSNGEITQNGGTEKMEMTTNQQIPTGMDYEASEGDISLVCRDCGCTFLFTVGEQEFYSMKGFEGQPTRCKPCRAQKKLSRENTNGNYPMNYMMLDAYGMPVYGYGGGNVPRKPCYTFQQRGECMFGSDCRYSHGEGAFGMFNGYGGYPMGYGMEQPGAFGYAPPHRGQGQPHKRRNPCFAFQRGQCTYGDRCRYSHDEVNGDGQPQTKLYCHAFQRGECTYGDTCKFAHE
mmetsp:Transcript_15796/g.23750  ORF Transcript_15796/g.23750 Transcript_15796/m.23750 type:complete len:261 (-) Transcript_15796:305-1087(-)|eukprot:CAMPEP_0185024148 /NCGR_PEP_ID=MMETSP1103-20130426/7109_1 /TAXON_ID=36769 /ORGANISM="Paraphysomonas bandaiensis, Strain Caron Lab Isolate" /LENGTH=260 /DNA_ID=CAMNT_0027557033 /DNA_START=84 /DNA_END=866 /DNA_ORIENTATION=+